MVVLYLWTRYIISSLLDASSKLASGNVGSKIDLLSHNQMLYDKTVNEGITKQKLKINKLTSKRR